MTGQDTPSPVVTRAEQTRLAILNAAYELFTRQGYSATSMRQIAQQAGVAVGSAYNHFTSKEQLFEHVLLHFHPYQYFVPILVQNSTTDIEQLVRLAAKSILDTLDSHPEFLNLMLIEMIEFNSAHIPIIINTVLGHVTPLLVGAFNQPGLKPIPIPLVIRSFFGLFFSYYVTERLMQNTPLTAMREEAMEAFIEIYLHGIVDPTTPNTQS